MKRFAIAGALALVAFVLAGVGTAVPAGATGTLDQSNMATITTTGALDCQPGFVFAQTFTAGLTGSLDQVDLFIDHSPDAPHGNLTVQVTTTSGGLPTSTVLASATVSPSVVPLALGWVSVPLSPPAASVAGTTYAVVLSYPGCLDFYEWAASGDAYAGGTGAYYENAAWHPEPQYDFLFKTYVAQPCGAPSLVGGATYRVTCNYTGATQTWTVPPGVTSATIDARGAQGGPGQDGTAGGKGGEAKATISVTPGDTLYVNVGGQPVAGNPASGGFNGGGQGGTASMGDANTGGGGGGGASDAREGGTDLAHRVVVAGGGGGGGTRTGLNSTPCLGAAGGGTTGDGAFAGCNGGGGANPTIGGTGSTGGSGPGTDGVLGTGGTGGNASETDGLNNSGGGGGGGLYGGGGGAGSSNGSGGGGGGGGSGFTASGTGMTNGVQMGNGVVTITYFNCTQGASSTTGNLNVASSGTTCGSGISVGGNVNVPAGGSLVLTNSHIGGNVNAKGARTVTMCGNTITGNVTVDNSTGPVLVGDAGDDAAACAGNTVGGTVTLSANTANTELGNNHINGYVIFTNNVGSTTSTETSPEVEANTIHLNLNCSGNVSVTNDSHPNTVSGNRNGQCGASGF